MYESNGRMICSFISDNFFHYIRCTYDICINSADGVIFTYPHSSQSGAMDDRSDVVVRNKFSYGLWIRDVKFIPARGKYIWDYL